MRNIGEVIYELLEEFDNICKENNIEYCLEGTIVHDAYLTNSIQNNTFEADISMDAENIKKIYEVIKCFSKPGRCFESIVNTKRKRSFVIRYLNTNTFCMDLRKSNRAVNKCIGLNIHLRVNKYDNPNAKKARKLQIAWKCGANNMKILYKNIFRCGFMKIKRAIFGEINVGKKVFKKWIIYNDKKINYDAYTKYLTEHGIDTNNVVKIMRKAFEEKKSSTEPLKMSELSNYDEYSIIRKKLPMLVVKGKKIPAFLYDELSYIDINGKKFPIVKEVELYLWFRFGINHGFNFNNDTHNENIIASEIISYGEFKKKHNKYLKRNRKLTRFASNEKQIREIIRIPIKRMFREFERTFYGQATNKDE